MKINTDNFKNYLDEYLEIYKNKPINDNTGGMKSPHLFNMFCLLKETKPKLIVESGVWKGQGTWLFEHASPDSDIICFDVYMKRLLYKSENALYIENDFTMVNWNSFFTENNHYNKDNTLLFLDDHVDFIHRLKFLSSTPFFKKIVFEDNYAPTQGDCVSPKKLRESTTCIIDKAGDRSEYVIPEEDIKLFKDKVSYYQELPPLFKPENTRWGDSWKNYNTPDPIFELNENSNETLVEEMYDYTWISYMELNDE
jgi:hypothetical protein